MNNLKVGMYVETKLHYIRKIIKVIENYEEFDVYEVDKEFRESTYYESTEILYPDEVLNKSFELIDLVEIGDYVNGYKIVKIFKNKLNGKKVLISLQRRENYKYSDFINDYMNDESIHIYNEDIKTIVTKGQFESINYKVKNK